MFTLVKMYEDPIEHGDFPASHGAENRSKPQRKVDKAVFQASPFPPVGNSPKWWWSSKGTQNGRTVQVKDLFHKLPRSIFQGAFAVKLRGCTLVQANLYARGDCVHTILANPG